MNIVTPATLKITQDCIQAITAEDGRTYQVEYEGQIYQFPSITTIIGNQVPKEGLPPWAWNLGIKAGWRAFKQGRNYSDFDAYKSVCRTLGPTIDGEKKAGQQRGIAVHSLLETIFEKPDVLPPEYQGYADQLAAFLDAYGIEPESAELKVASLEHEFAGQLDLIAKVTKHPVRRKHESLVGKRVLIDLKTNAAARVYPRVHLPQVEGYALGYHEMGGDPVDAKLVVAVSDEKYAVCVSYARPETFLCLLNCYKEFYWMQRNNPNGRK